MPKKKRKEVVGSGWGTARDMILEAMPGFAPEDLGLEPEVMTKDQLRDGVRSVAAAIRRAGGDGRLLSIVLVEQLMPLFQNLIDALPDDPAGS